MGIPAMRYLRHHAQDFFVRQLDILPSKISHMDNIIHQLNQRGWLLKTFALELHVSSSLDYKQRLLSLLFDAPLDSRPDEESILSELKGTNLWEQPRMKLLELLDATDFPLTDLQAWKRPQSLFANVDVDSCGYIGKRGLPLIDIKRFYKLLVGYCSSKSDDYYR